MPHLMPPQLSVRRSCSVAGLDPETAWAVVIGPPEYPKVYGVRADEKQAKTLSQHVRNMGSIPQVTACRDLLSKEGEGE